MSDSSGVARRSTFPKAGLLFSDSRFVLSPPFQVPKLLQVQSLLEVEV